MENPIDKDKISENPHNLPYAHHVGSAVIKPTKEGKIKGTALAAMYEQTQGQLDIIKEQMTLLAQQAKKIQERVEISEDIYMAKIGFKPIIGHIYYLYRREDGSNVLSMIPNDQWGKKFPFESYLAAVKLLPDHTWDVLESHIED